MNEGLVQGGRAPAGLAAAFRRCAGELGMWSAARLFVMTASKRGGPGAVDALRAALGNEFPVLDALASEEGDARSDELLGPPPALVDVVARCADLRRLVVVGLEADCLEPLLARLAESVTVALIPDVTFPADDDRRRAAWGDRVQQTDLASFQRFAGSHSALLTTVYGTDSFSAVVARVWIRCHGGDVRTQFRHLIGWNVMPRGMDRHPRWLVETPAAEFTELFGDAAPTPGSAP